MASKFFILLLVIATSLTATVRAQGSGGGNGPPCVQALLPCQPFLKGEAVPPPTCCGPLKQLLSGDYRCLCAIIDNEALMKSFNVTKDDALRLPQKCGITVDLNKCKSATSAPSPSSPKVSPPPPPPPPAKASESPKKSAAPYCEKQRKGSRAAVPMLWALMASLII